MNLLIFIIALFRFAMIKGELGEYDPEIHEGNYISEHKLLLKQTEAIEAKAMELHQTQLKGFTAEQAETHFLRLASQLDTYAVDPHPVKVKRVLQKHFFSTYKEIEFFVDLCIFFALRSSHLFLVYPFFFGFSISFLLQNFKVVS